MSKNTTVSLTLQIKGNAGQELKKVADQQVQATTKINQQWTQIGSAQAKFVQTAKAGTQATVNTARAGDQLLRTNRMLEGVLRQQSIQTKIQSQQLKQQQASTQQMANWMIHRGKNWANPNLGSRLYLLSRSKDLPRNLLLAKQYAEEALEDLVPSRFESITVAASQSEKSRVDLTIDTVRITGESQKILYFVPVGG